MGKGLLKVQLFVADQALPVANMKVLIRDANQKILYELMSDENGLTKEVALDAPDKKGTLDPYSKMPRFSVYDVEVPRAKGYKKTVVHGVQIFDQETSILPVQMHPEIVGDSPQENTDEIYIPLEHGVDMKHGFPDTLEEERQIMEEAMPAAAILANEVAIPEYITVHLGSPNAAAPNVRIPFIDYIKNVASSEIFPNWEEAALYANIYCQISFALNRVYTSWYRSRGFSFEITNSTAFDQFFVDGRNIFQNISRIVDDIFNNFIRRQGRREPFFAQYCNGTTVTCDGLYQWGSQDLALKGYTPIQILKYYYPSDIQIVESNNFTANVGTYPGIPLSQGATGQYVLRMQRYLNRISGNFFIPVILNPNGVFEAQTKASTTKFQEINNLIPDGIIGKSTWYSITKIFVAVTRLAELDSEGERIGIGTKPPTSVLQLGSRGEDVVELQFLINFISEFYPTVPFVIQNGVFREDTKRGVTEFQKEFGLTPDGIVGPATWQKLYDVYYSIKNTVTVPEVPPTTPPPTVPPSGTPAFPGNLKLGSRGDEVAFMQNYLLAISKTYPIIPPVAVNGTFGVSTQDAVTAFQRFFGLTPDGIIGKTTWDKIIDIYKNLSNISSPPFPGVSLRQGSRGNDVTTMQKYLNEIARQYTSIPTLTVDGIFGPNTEQSVKAFQREFGQTVDGIIGRNTWNFIVSLYNRITGQRR